MTYQEYNIQERGIPERKDRYDPSRDVWRCMACNAINAWAWNKYSGLYFLLTLT